MLYYSEKKNELLPSAAIWIDIENIILSEVSQTNIIWYHLYVESKKNTNETIYKQSRNRLINTENKLMFTKVKREWGRTNKKYRVNRYM